MDIRGPVMVVARDRAAFPREWIIRSRNPSRTRKLQSIGRPCAMDGAGELAAPRAAIR